MPDLCELDDVKAWLNIANANGDAVLSRLISAVSADFANCIGRSDFFPAIDYLDVFDGPDPRWRRHWEQFRTHYRRQLELNHRPINSIASVTVDGTDMPASADGVADGYWYDPTEDPEFRVTLKLIGNATAIGPRSQIVVRYNAGYDEVPPDVVQAVIEWVAYRYRSRDWIGQISKHMNQGETVQFQNVTMPATTQAVVQKYQQAISLL
jgi:Phage gp6-like head-tail connector protein